MPAFKVLSPNARILQQPVAPIRRVPDDVRQDAGECARVASLPVQHAHAAGIDVGDSTHWVRGYCAMRNSEFGIRNVDYNPHSAFRIPHS